MKKFIFILLFCIIPTTFLHVEPSKQDLSFLNGAPTYKNVYKACILFKIKHPKTVVAQSVLETGHYTSKHCVNYNNLFGLYDSKRKRYHRYKHWTLSVKAYKDEVQYKYKGGDYYKFLKRIGYASDPAYINKVKSVKANIKFN